MQPSSPSLFRAFRRVFLNMTVALGLFGVVMLLTQPTVWKPETLFAVSAALSVASAAVVPLVGRLRPLPLGLTEEEAAKTGVAAFRGRMFLRLVVTEAPALIALIVSTILGTSVPYLVSGAIAVALMLLFVVPNRRDVAAAEGQLDSGGAASRLSAVLGV
jgi:hypothetical protein